MRGASDAAVFALAAAALLAGCGGGGKSTSTTTGAAGAVIQGFHVLAVVDVHETEYKLDPRTIGFQRTGYFGLRAVNDGAVSHALAVSGPGVSKRTRTIQPGGSEAIAVYFRKPGVYKLYCPLDSHRRRGMIGTVRVL
jgi:plastocyanin